ncbi:major facilitator superfamily domain-containing protein [Radiomyces spectabilis]|uniref:major facilitator superfamily domain-containing protein n=1 Tax=Radiomyces spectabilis TaxID=64574 RepID=UPI0022205D21|nr:major facilitator superfamily domain-containing protein [Radiomyces spectabilis]KAI8370656.1 major facilitator superfamily domain-containing protein [Radiomyces spectabilis]
MPQFPAIPHLTNDLNTNSTIMSLTTSLFILFAGIGPILWASMSDYYHVRRFFYLIGLAIFVIASVGCALTNEIWLLVVLRCVQSIGTSGTVSDCWQVTERGAAFSILFIGQFFGPLVGPVIGGGLASGLGWRSTFWFCAGYGVFLLLFLSICLPETYRENAQWEFILPITSEKPVHSSPYPKNMPYPKAFFSHKLTPSDQTAQPSYTTVGSPLGQSSPDVSRLLSTTPTPALSTTSIPASSSAIGTSMKRRFNPLASITMLKYTFVWLTAIQTGICFGTMFTIETIIPELFVKAYNFRAWQTGLSFLGAGIGNLLGSLVAGRLSDYLLKRSRRQRGGIARAEDRLTSNAWPGGFILVPFGVLLFGWGVNAELIVWASIVGFGIVCFGMSQVYAAGSAYLVDAIPEKSASVTAAANLLRMAMACILSVTAHPVNDHIGPGYLVTILAGLNFLGMICFAIVKFKGMHMRRKAGFQES